VSGHRESNPNIYLNTDPNANPNANASANANPNTNPNTDPNANPSTNPKANPNSNPLMLHNHMHQQWKGKESLFFPEAVCLKTGTNRR